MPKIGELLGKLATCQNQSCVVPVPTAAGKLSDRLMVTGNTMKIFNVTSDDVAVFRCHASNLYGDASAAAYLNVYSKIISTSRLTCYAIHTTQWFRE